MSDNVEDIKNMSSVERTKTILVVKVIEKLEPEDDGVTLNEGYQYEVDGAFPQIADGLAKMFIELDKDASLGENAGGALLTLVNEYYTKLRTNE